MKVLVIGSGAREHALAAKIAESPFVETLYAAPGNAGMETVTLRSSGFLLEPVRMEVSDIDGLCSFAQCVGIDLTVVGPELPLALGIVDRFLEWGLPIVGPTKAAARLETSKIFAKQFMWSYGIPTAHGAVAYDMAVALGYIHDHFRTYGTPLVVKADGLARGRGSFVCRSEDAAVHVARALVEEGTLGEAGRSVVLEHFLYGEEISVHILTNGTDWRWLPVSQDYKRLTADPESPMTGGMGAISPVSACWNPVLEHKTAHLIIEPTLSKMRECGMPFQGVLYVGLMIVQEKSPEPYVLEYNVRFGDPEAEAILPRVRGDIVPYFCSVASRPRDVACSLPFVGEVTSQPIEFSPRHCVCVVLTSAGYPGAAIHHGHHLIEGLDIVATLSDTHVYHTGTVRGNDGRFQTLDGRVLSIVGEGDTLDSARGSAYTAVEKIHWTGIQYRLDIGLT